MALAYKPWHPFSVTACWVLPSALGRTGGDKCVLGVGQGRGMAGLGGGGDEEAPRLGGAASRVLLATDLAAH